MPNLRTLLGACVILALVGCAGLQTGSEGPRVSKRDQLVQLQIFLDARHFGPGVIDGIEGEFTAKALAHYNESMGRPPEAQPDISTIIPYTTYTITPEDLAMLGSMASEPADIAQQKKLPYVGLGEVVAERFRTSRAFIANLNPEVEIDALPAGAVLKVPNVTRPFRVRDFPSGYPRTAGAATPDRRILIDTSTRMLALRDGDRLVAAFPITPGSAEHPAPAGNWKIAGIAPWPWFRYDEGVLKRGERTSTFYMYPPGPNSPVGILWAALNRPGIGIHGTGYPETIGRSGSHGCIRLSNWDAATFYTLIRTGIPVTIR